MSELYRKAMDGIFVTVAMQEIRKVVRSKGPDQQKLEKIVGIVHEYEEDAEQAELAAERRAIEADEAEMRRERINDMFEEMQAPLDKLVLTTTGTGGGKK